jgi:two-component system phosphate regulon response regulator PhoB
MAATTAKPYRVLIVEDDPAARELLAEVLAAPNRSVEVRDSAQAALEFLQQNPVDLAFVQWKLPGISGAKLAEKIKQRCPGAHVLLCTALPGTEPLNDAAAKAERFLHESINLGEVLQLADSCSAE